MTPLKMLTTLKGTCVRVKCWKAKEGDLWHWHINSMFSYPSQNMTMEKLCRLARSGNLTMYGIPVKLIEEDANPEPQNQ